MSAKDTVFKKRTDEDECKLQVPHAPETARKLGERASSRLHDTTLVL